MDFRASAASDLPLAQRFTALVFALSLVTLVLAVIAILEFTFLDIAPNAEGTPMLSADHLLRLLVSGGLGIWLVFTVSPAGATYPDNPAYFTRIWVFTYIAAVLGLVLFSVSPQGFHALSREDDLIETTSALLLFGASALFVLAGRRRFRLSGSPIARAFPFMLAFILLIIGLEEISWGQRIFGFPTPSFLNQNQQGEAHFHNLATNLSEMIYFVGATFILIVCPLFCGRSDLSSELGSASGSSDPLSGLLPLPAVALCAAPMAGLNYDMFNIMPLQVTIFVTIAALLRFARHYRTAGNPAWKHFAGMAILVVVIQIAFLIGGERMISNWRVTEYKECAIAFGFAVYALHVYRSSRYPAERASSRD